VGFTEHPGNFNIGEQKHAEYRENTPSCQVAKSCFLILSFCFNVFNAVFDHLNQLFVYSYLHFAFVLGLSMFMGVNLVFENSLESLLKIIGH